MGVMSCAVSGCHNILCDKYHPKYGYICDLCFGRLVKKGVKTDIKEFFNTSIEPDEEDEEATRAYFEKLFL